MLTPRLDASGGALLHRFILFGDVCLVMGEKKALGDGKR
jgi:hypothetical protein